MAVRELADLLEDIGKMFGDDVSDEKLRLLEDISDTVADATAPRPEDGEDWKAKYEENDRMWRQRYRDRFMSGPEVSDKIKVELEVERDPEPEPKTLTYEELFKEEVK